jgi:undecaprenyl-diphosphatase
MPLQPAPPVQQRIRRPLIAPAWRPVAFSVFLVALVGLATLSIGLHDKGTGTGFDNATLRWLLAHTSTGVQQLLLGLSEPTLVLVLLAAIALIAGLMRRWDVVALAVVGPAVALILTEVVLKPIVHRLFGLRFELSHGLAQAGPAFPSGHETGLASLTTVLIILIGRAPLSRRVRIIGATVLALWAVAGAVGLVRSYYHYATDTVGGACVGGVCVVGVALILDATQAKIKSAPPR